MLILVLLVSSCLAQTYKPGEHWDQRPWRKCRVCMDPTFPNYADRINDVIDHRIPITVLWASFSHSNFRDQECSKKEYTWDWCQNSCLEISVWNSRNKTEYQRFGCGTNVLQFLDKETRYCFPYLNETVHRVDDYGNKWKYEFINILPDDVIYNNKITENNIWLVFNCFIFWAFVKI